MNSRTHNNKLSRFAVVALLISAGVFSSVALLGSDKAELKKKKTSAKIIRVRDGITEKFSSDSLSAEEQKKIEDEMEKAMKDVEESLKDLNVNIDLNVLETDDSTGKEHRIIVRGLKNCDSVMKLRGNGFLRLRTLHDSIGKYSYRFNFKQFDKLSDSLKTLYENLPAIPELPRLPEIAVMPRFPKEFRAKKFHFKSFSDSAGNTKKRKIIIIETDDTDTAIIEKGEMPDISPGEGTSDLGRDYDNIPAIREINIFPNPSDGKINLNFSAPDLKNATITISNLDGKEIYREDLNNFSGEYSKTIDLSGKGKGTYILNITSGGKTFSEKIMLE